MIALYAFTWLTLATLAGITLGTIIRRADIAEHAPDDFADREHAAGAGFFLHATGDTDVRQ